MLLSDDQSKCLPGDNRKGENAPVKMPLVKIKVKRLAVYLQDSEQLL